MGPAYQLRIGEQPLVNPDEVRVRFRVEGGWEIARSRTLRTDESGVAATVDLRPRRRLGHAMSPSVRP